MPEHRRPRDRLKASRADAVEVFVTEHWDYVFRVAYLVSLDAEQAGDIAQDAIVKALRARQSFDGSRPVRPWIARIAANSAKDWLRRQARSREELLDPAPAEWAAAENAEVASLAEQSLDEDLAAALTELEPTQRAVIVMRHLLDMETSEIAELLGIAPGTVRSRSHRGLAILRVRLQGVIDA